MDDARARSWRSAGSPAAVRRSAPPRPGMRLPPSATARSLTPAEAVERPALDDAGQRPVDRPTGASPREGVKRMRERSPDTRERPNANAAPAEGSAGRTPNHSLEVVRRASEMGTTAPIPVRGTLGGAPVPHRAGTEAEAAVFGTASRRNRLATGQGRRVPPRPGGVP